MSAPIFGYWDVRGLGAPIRYLLEQANVSYVDKLYKCGPPPDFDRTEWMNDKFNLKLDFPNLPYLIDGDVRLTQSQAILKYLGRKYGFEPKSEKAQQRVDVALAQISDYHLEFARMCYTPDFAKLKEAFIKTVPDKMKALSDFLGDYKFVAGDYVTYVDFTFFEFLEQQAYVQPDVLKDFPKLETYRKNVASLEGVKRYFESPKAIKFPFNGAPAVFGGAYSDQLSKSS